MQETGQVRAIFRAGWSGGANSVAIPPKHRVLQMLERCCLLVCGWFVTHWHYYCGWTHIAQTMSRSGVYCRTKIVPVLHLAAQRYASAERMSAGARRHPCISHTLVRFVPSQWTASETDMTGPHRGAIESRRIGRALWLGRIRRAMAEKGLTLPPPKRAKARPP
jgi:hypothetical protein